ncbi:hypothetical protein SPKIRA_08290 [Sphingomonas paucimobilis]|uniref:terminase small subunit n=1 Tax=Sphingomonas paucimobilis TaxID=13689 RepID=UPI0015DC701E|nr:terminase small subunit [Sphingomonas paucimobilis]BCI69999.1 hypothetical protein SPKIRA_08290 [Sphingomonas paucimobilis]
MGRRQRIDSAAGVVATMAAAARDLSPPAHLRIRKGDLPFWDAVIAEKPKSEWTDSDLAVAANLVRAMADAERVAGYSVVGGGNINGEKLLETIDVSDKLARRIVTLRRALGLDNRAKNGEQRDVNRRREHATEIEAVSRALDDDDLIARPTYQ